jgi:hypothetical protein
LNRFAPVGPCAANMRSPLQPAPPIAAPPPDEERAMFRSITPLLRSDAARIEDPLLRPSVEDDATDEGRTRPANVANPATAFTEATDGFDRPRHL